MKAISTKYIPASNYLGSRIAASDEDGNRIVMSWNGDLDSIGNSKMAATTLLKKMKWTGKWVAGGTKNGFVWVCLWNKKQKAACPEFSANHETIIK